MFQAGEVTSLASGEPGLISSQASVDVTAVLRNLKLRRESCSAVSMPGMASPEAKGDLLHLPPTHERLPPDVGIRPPTAAAPDALLGEDLGIKHTGYKERTMSSASGSDWATPPRVRRWSLYTNGTSPSMRSPAGNVESAHGAVDTASGKASAGNGSTAWSLASTPAGSSPVVTVTSPGPAAQQHTHGGAAAAESDAGPLLSPSASAPVSAQFPAAFLYGTARPPPVTLPTLKSVSSRVLLPEHGAAWGSAAKPPVSAASSLRALAAAAAAAGSAAGTSNSDIGNGLTAALCTGPDSAVISPQTTAVEALAAVSRRSLCEGGRGVDGSNSSGGGGGGSSGLMVAVDSRGGSGSASPSVRPSGVAATAFAAASAIVAATSAAAASRDSGSAAAVAAAAAEVARDIADTVGGRTPPSPSRSPSHLFAKVAAAATASATSPLPAAEAAGSAATAASASNSAGTELPIADVEGGGGSCGGVVGSPFGTASRSSPLGAAALSTLAGNVGSPLNSLRRSSLELQIARLKASSEDYSSAAAAATAKLANAHASGCPTSYVNGHSKPVVISLQHNLSSSVLTGGGGVGRTSGTDMAVTLAVGKATADAGPLGDGVSSGQWRSAEPQKLLPPEVMHVARGSGGDGGSGGGAGGAAAAADAQNPGGVPAGAPVAVLQGSVSAQSPGGAGAVANAGGGSGGRVTSMSSLVAQRGQLLDELQASHKRELALAEQLGRARAEVLELTAQLARQKEAAAAAAAAEAEVAELRGQLRKARAEASEEVRRWRSRATAAEEQLQTALTQLVCLRSAAAKATAAAAPGISSSSGGATPLMRPSGGGGGAAYTARISSGGSAAAAAVSGSPALSPERRASATTWASAVHRPTAAYEDGEGVRACPWPLASSGPSSPLRRRSRDSPADLLDATPPPPPLRRSLSYQTLGLETTGSDAAVTRPSRAVSTSGGAAEIDAEDKFLMAGVRKAAPVGSGGGGDGGVAGPEVAAGVRPPRPRPAPQSPSSSVATTAAAADGGGGGGGSAAGVSTPASATASYGSSYGSPASLERSPYGFGFSRGDGGGAGGLLRGSGSGGGATSGGFDDDTGDAEASSKGGKSHGGGTAGAPVDVSSADGSSHGKHISGGGGAAAAAATAGWAVAAAAAAANGNANETRVYASHSVPEVELRSGSQEFAPPLAGSISAALPGAAVTGAAGAKALITAALPPADMAALTAVPEGVDGTAVLHSRGVAASASAAAGAGAGSDKGEAAAAVTLLVAAVERLKQAGNRAYRSDQYPLARHFYTSALELLLPPGSAISLHGRPVGPVAVGGIASAVAAGVLGGVSSDGGGAECAAAAAVAAAAACERGGDAATGAKVPGEQRIISALYCSRAAAHVAMRLYPDAVADCCAASAHDEAYAKPWKCRAEALASVNAFGAAAAALERCIELTTLAAASAAAAAAGSSRKGAAAAAAAVSVPKATSVTIGGAATIDTGGGSPNTTGSGSSYGELVEFNDVDPRELPLLRHILQRLQELARASAAPAPSAAAALLAAMTGTLASGAPPVDHYAVLGVPYHATEMDVKAAYKRLALQYHPDKAAAAAAAAGAAAPSSPIRAAVVAAAQTVFPLVAEAYAVLSDKASRKAYDIRRARVALSTKRHGAS